MVFMAEGVLAREASDMETKNALAKNVAASTKIAIGLDAYHPDTMYWKCGGT